MYPSIQQFIENGIPKIEKIAEDMLTGQTPLSSLEQCINDEVLKLGSDLLKDLLEGIDTALRDSVIRKNHWYIEHRSESKTLLNMMGNMQFCRTGFKDKQSGEYVYLLDRILGIGKHQKITLGAAARALEETILSSYAKGGRTASARDSISKEAVKDLVHNTVIKLPTSPVLEKKKLKCLRIVADEDHVAAQYWIEKGDLQKDANGNKINTLMPKLICLFEDVVDDSTASGKHRYRLIGKHYFSGLHKGYASNIRFWEEVQAYITEQYDTEELERIYIAGDGARWIRTGVDVLEKSSFVLDKFHMMKRINESVSHLGAEEDAFRAELWACINRADKDGLRAVYRRILSMTEKDSPKYKAVQEARHYLLNQWDGIEIRVTDASGQWKCCAEGQVSHLLSDRMSSRPMGWSAKGCDQMAKLRAFHWNGGKVIDLLEYQKKERQKQERIREQEELLKDLRARQRQSYAERMRGGVPGLERADMSWMRDLINGVMRAI